MNAFTLTVSGTWLKLMLMQTDSNLRYTKTVDKQEFVKKVMNELPKLDDKFDIDRMVATAEWLFDVEFNLSDAVSYCSNFEEVDPHIPEDVAISNIKRLSQKYGQ
jgi:hypothetical protein